MVRDLVIHIGDPKTGSTAIQEVLATGGWSAPGLTALYPARVNHLALARSFYDPAERGERGARFGAVARQIAGSDADVAILSAELFEQADPADLAAALAEYLPALAPRARIVAYVRPHAERLVSAWAERVKQGNTTDGLSAMAARAMAKGQFLYAPRFTRWRAVFGDRLTVRPFLRDRLAGGDVVADFLGIVAAGRPVTITRPAAANESLGLADLAMLRAFHLRVAGRADLAEARRAVGWNLAQHLAGLPRPAVPAAGAQDRPRLPRALVPAVQAAYGADAAAMDAAFFAGVPTLAPALARAAETAVEAEPSLAIEDHFGPDDRRLIAVWADLAAMMLDHDPDLIPAHFRARQQAVYGAAQGGERGGEPAPARRAGGAGAGKAGPGKAGPGKAGGRAGPAGADAPGLSDAALAAFLPPDMRRKPGPGGPGRGAGRGTGGGPRRRPPA